MSVTSRQVVDALKHRYTGDQATEASVTTNDLVSYLKSPEARQSAAGTDLLGLISQHNPEWIPGASELAVLRAVQDCLKLIFNLVDLESRAEAEIWRANPALAGTLIEHPTLPVDGSANTILQILDQLLDATIGWSDDQGRAGENLMNKVQEVVEQLGESDLGAVYEDLKAFVEKDQGRTHKLEERLAASEAGKLRSKRGRAVAAEMLNKAMKGNQLTANMVNFLKGPWFGSVQLLAITQGIDSDEFIRASKLTETIIWTYQPIDAENQIQAEADKQKLYRIIEHLPSEIRDLSLALEHNTDDLEAALEDIEQDHILMVSGQELEYVEFDLIEVEGETISQGASVSRILMRKVAGLEEGQWFTYSEGEKHIRIKLVLKLQDVKQMLFTNRNGMKALEKTYDEMAYLMSSSVLKPLNHDAVFSTTFSSFFTGIIEDHQRKLKQAEEADQAEREREAARKKALEEAAALERTRQDEERERQRQEKEERIERAREAASRSENQEKLAELSDAVRKLQIGAWLKLPAADGTLEECKLAVRVASADKFIFVSRTGVKMGEFTSEQLTALLVAGEGEIADTGVEFEDTLAQVVSKLRQDRNRSYDDLTGSE